MKPKRKESRFATLLFDALRIDLYEISYTL